jgi:arylsulfatase A-like enzyme
MLRATSIALLALAACARPEAALPPDVVILLADDLGWADVGYHGSTAGEIPPSTPSIDALARGGLRLERYRTAPLCTPARAGLLTGRSPLRLGLRRNVVATDRDGLPLDEELLPAAFARAGYATAMVGKWHLGHAQPAQRPNARGFGRFYGFLTGWVDYAKHERDGAADWWRDGEPIREEGYATSLFAREAVSILSEKGRSRPLFLYVAFNAPHPPVHVPPGRKVEAGSEDGMLRGAYALMVSELDGAVGEILKAIETGPRARETIVFFASDNGADPRWGGSNAPLRGGKYEAYEGGIRSPAVLWWPGRVRPGESERLVAHVDVLPTIAGLAGVALDPPRPLDGVDLWPGLSGASTVEREPVAPVAFGVEDGELGSFALVGERWKLVESIRSAAPPVCELFDLAVDPDEAHDLAGEDPERIVAMRAALDLWTSMPRTLPPIPSQR